MTYDLVIANGTVVDGSGSPGYRADVGVSDGRIAFIGRNPGRAASRIDAEGHVVAPGFVDGHTHMDAQVFWDRLGSCSCYHGVTSVVMGNCGFTLAPCRESEADLVFRNLERAEDIAREAMLAGIEWRWETYPEYLDVVDALPKGINYAGYIGHSALRTYVMGQRAFEEEATQDDVERMAGIVQDAVRAGAVGFTTSRSPNHQTSDHKPVASRLASWEEVRTLVNAMGRTGLGMFEIAAEATGRDPLRMHDYQQRLKALAIESGVPVTWGMFATRQAPEVWRSYFDLLDEVAEAGGRMFAQVHSRSICVIYTFESHLPFDSWDTWRDVRRLPLTEQKAQLEDPALKAKLVEVASRLRGVCSRSQSAMENALKALVHLYADEAPGKVHSLDELADRIPERLRPAVAAAMAGLDLPEVSNWRQRGTYPADFPDMTLEDLVVVVRAFASAACTLGGLAAQHVAAAAPAAPEGTPPAAGAADWEAARTARLCAGIESILAGWNLDQETPTAQMGIPEPPD